MDFFIKINLTYNDKFQKFGLLLKNKKINKKI